MTECDHMNIVVWTIEEVGQQFNLETEEWGDEVGHLVRRITAATCADCKAELALTPALEQIIWSAM